MPRKKILITTSIIIVVIASFFLLKGIKISKFFWQYFFQKEIELKKREESVNVLFLGIGGGSHEGPNLTDTIIYANIDPEGKKVTLLSIPRDLWVPDLKAKINSAYAFGEEKREGGGLILAKAVISKLINQPIHYAVRIDFNGFTKAVDMVNGLDVEVENILNDYAYPISGKEKESCDHTDEEIIDLTARIATQSATELEAFPCRYKHIYFDKGLQRMDGEKALEFVRSRHALGKEGTDFARSKRQEKVILAFKNKLFSLETIFNPGRVFDLYKLVEDSIDMDIKEEELDDFIKLAEKLKDAKVKNIILDFGDLAENRYGLLTNPLSGDFNGQWVLAPRAGNNNFLEIQKYVECELKSENCLISPKPTY